MTLTIDNLDGAGAQDYTAAVDAAEPLTIVRALNEPSLLKALLTLAGTALKPPVRQARVLVAADAGAVLFTGYLTVEPVAVYAGVASAGPVYRLALTAVSDEWLLDKESAGVLPGVAYGASAGTLLTQLAARLAPSAAGLLRTAGLAAGQPVGVYVPLNDPDSVSGKAGAWSTHAAQTAASTYASYRALNGALTLTQGAGTHHVLSDGDGTLTVATLQQSAVRELANDVTVSGAIEPAAYWTELFLGDGTTVEFDLGGEPDAPGGGHAVLIDDRFAGALLDPNTWTSTDPGSHLALNGANQLGGGLTLNGGNGLDGQTVVLGVDQVELGGTVVFELDGVTLNPGSAGMLCALYDGAPVLANCVAGFQITQAAGQTMVQPVVNGMATGTAYTLAEGHFYTLRLHLNAPELLRVKQTYYALTGVAGGSSLAQPPEVVAFGGGLADSPLALVFELRDQGVSSNTYVSVLYDGAMQDSPAQATFAVVNALELFGAVGAVNVTRTGTAWITSTPPGASSMTRLAGKAGQGGDATVTSSAAGHVRFFAGRVPAPNEPIAVAYRGRQRAVARVADPVSQAAEAAGGGVGTARWVGKVVSPVARTAEDCENAATAILSFATDRAAAATGTYRTVWPLASGTGDVWPGDLLTFSATTPTGIESTSVIVRKVTIAERGASPEALTYTIAFANDWAEGLGIKLSEALATDALVPTTAIELMPGAPESLPAHGLASLNQVTVIGAANALTVDAGTDPPAGGGFEVRRHDGGFGSGRAASAGAGDLVLRSPVRGFSIPRAEVEETFFIRMYDGSTPPLYSRASAAIVTHLPV